jgi:hypothetical protein
MTHEWHLGGRGAGFEASADATGGRRSAARDAVVRVVLFPRFGSLCTSCASRSAPACAPRPPGFGSGETKSNQIKSFFD